MNMKDHVQLKLLYGIVGSIFATEFTVMLFLDRFALTWPVLLRALVDSASLSLVSYAVLYRLSYRPLLSEISERKRAEAALQKSYSEIELTVRERTESLRAEIESRKGTEKALRKSEEQYRGVVDNIGVGVVVINPKREIIALNRKMKEWFPAVNLSEKSVCYRMFYDPPREEACPSCPATLTLQDGLNHEAVIEMPAKGVTRYLRIISSPLRDPDGKIASALVLVDDITGQKRVEEEIRRLNDDLKRRVAELEEARLLAEAANRAKSEFLANMSHEVTTPLNSIIGFSQVLQDGLYGGLNAKQQEYVSDILESGMHLMVLLNDILDLTKLESGDTALRTSSFLLKDVLKSVLTMFHAEAMKHNLRLDFELAPEADVEVETDLGKLSQVLFNLLSNAVKFTPDGGAVRVAARLTNDAGQGTRDEKSSIVRASDASGRLSSIEISVADTGIGIRQEDIPKLFKDIAQLEPPYTKKFSGTGVGLILTRKLVELLGGEIGAESEPGVGSVFRVVIPIKAGSAAGQHLDAARNRFFQGPPKL